MDSLLWTLAPFIAGLVGMVILGVWINTYWSEISFWWMCVLARVPWFGTIAQLARRRGASLEMKPGLSNISRAEAAFGAMAQQRLGRVSREGFARLQTYLKRTGDDHMSLRRPPWLMTLGIVLLVPESIGIAYVAGPALAGMDVTPAVREILALGIGAVFALGMYFATTSAGSQARRIRTARYWQVRADANGYELGDEARRIGPDDPQDVDDTAPGYRQFEARADPSPAMWQPVALLAMVAAIGGIVMVERQREFAAELARTATIQAAQAAPSSLDTLARSLTSAVAMLGDNLSMWLFPLSFALVHLVCFVHGWRDGPCSDKSLTVLRETGSHTFYEAYAAEFERRFARLQTLFAMLQGKLRVKRQSTPSLRDVISFLELERVGFEGHMAALAAKEQPVDDPTHRPSQTARKPARGARTVKHDRTMEILQ